MCQRSGGHTSQANGSTVLRGVAVAPVLWLFFGFGLLGVPALK